MVFSTGESTAREQPHLIVNSQSSLASEEPNRPRPSGHLSSRNKHDPGKIPPSGLIMSPRNSVSESTKGKSNNFSPRLNRGGGGPGGNGDEILDEEEDKGDPGGGTSGGGRALNKPQSVDGIFEVVPQNDDDDEDEDELTYNSQGKPMPRSRVPLDKR